MAIKLPNQPWKEGDSFVVDETGLEYTYNGEVWVSEGKEIDLSGLAEEGHTHELEDHTHELQNHNHSEYLGKGGTQTLDEGRWLLKHPKADGSGNFSYIEIDTNDNMGLYHVKYPENAVHAANMQYVDDEVAKVDTEVRKLATEIINKSDSTHTHSYASTNHTHSDVPSHSHTGSTMKSGTSSNPSLSKGEMYLNTNLKVVYVGM